MPADPAGRSPAYLREGYAKSIKVQFKQDEKTGLMTPNHETLHWSGRQDAHVYPKPIYLKIAAMLRGN